MATTVAELKAVLSADTRDFDRALGRSETKTQRFGRVAKAALVSGVAAGFYVLAKAAKIGWDEFNEGQRVAAQTNAVLKSTHGIANVTADGVERLAHALMLKSGIDDEVIKSGENMLLTFTHVRNEAGKGNDIFNQATKAALDLSVATGKDLVGANVMLGKALQDPIRGLTALRRVGVSFTNSQEETIKKLVESGHTMKAQKIILAELRKEFGGSAAAAGKTFGGQINILRERLNNFLGLVVERAIPLIQRLSQRVIPRVNEALQFATRVVDQLRRVWNETAAVLRRHQESVAVMTQALRGMGSVLRIVIGIMLFWLRTVITVWIKATNVVLTATDKIIGGIRAIAGAVRTVVGWLQTFWNWLTRIFGRVWSLQFHVPDPTPGFDIPGIPGFARGGTVPGPLGAPRLIMAHGGETVTPAGAGGSTYNFYGAVLDGEKLLRFIRDANNRYGRNNGGRGAF